MPHFPRSLHYLVLFMGFILLSIAIWDLKHPHIEEDRCILAALGKQVSLIKPTARLLYTKTASPEQDIALRCHRTGLIWFNDSLILPPNDNQPVRFLHKRYAWMPDRYHFFIGVHNPTKG
jgi:hypothetical protein